MLKGEDGFSPTVEVIETENGNLITITDKEGANTFVVKNGKDGAQGLNGEKGEQGVGISNIQQTITSTSSQGVNAITITLSNGKTTIFSVRNGEKGEKGE